MIRKLFYTILLSLIQISNLICNDGGFYASGNTIFPLEETQIELRKEYLNLTFRDNLVYVDIQFEFFNPGQEDKLIIGFVTPPAVGVISEEELRHPHIMDYKVMFENQILKYKVHKVDSTDFNKLEGKAKGQDFIYYSDVSFKPGVNIIQHSYKYKGAFSIDGTDRFSYRLTTGNSWANKQIDEFNLSLNFGENKYVCIPTILEKEREIDWLAYGVSKMTADKDKHNRIKGYFVSGGLITQILDFQPDFDLEIDLIGIYPEDLMYFKTGLGPSPKSSSLDELRIMKNALFAIKGYKFKSQDLFEYFSKYAWYIPDADVKNSLDLLSEREKEWLDEIQKEIERKKSH